MGDSRSYLDNLLVKVYNNLSKKGAQAYTLVDTIYKFAQTSLIEIDLVMRHLIPMEV